MVCWNTTKYYLLLFNFICKIDSAVASNETERFFYLGWVINNFYNVSGNYSWFWTQTDGTVVQLDLGNPPLGFNVSKRECLEKRGYCYRIKGINTNSEELGHSVKADETFTLSFFARADKTVYSIPIEIKGKLIHMFTWI